MIVRGDQFNLAVEDGRISRQRLDQSVARVLAAKTSLGLTNKKKLVNLDAISDTLDWPGCGFG